MNVLGADTFQIRLGPLRCSDGRELGDQIILAGLVQRLELRGVGMSQVVEIKRIRDNAFQAFAYIDCRGSIGSTISAARCLAHLLWSVLRARRPKSSLSGRAFSRSASSSSSSVATMLILLPCRRRMRLPRAKRDRDGLSFSERNPNDDPARSSETMELSVEVIEEPGERREEVEVVVLLLERPLKTDKRLGLLAWAVDLERICAAYSGCSLEEFVDGRSLPSSLSQALLIGGGG